MRGEGTSTAATVGVDVGGTSTRVGVVDTAGDVVALNTTPTPRGPNEVARHLAAEVESIIERAALRVAGVGVGIPGRVDPRRGDVSMAVNVGIGTSIPLGTMLTTAVGLPVAVGNDVDLAALGADRHLRAGGADPTSLVYLSVGTGFAVGLVVAGRLHTGQHGAGEIGHVPIPGVHERCPCGQIGCAETVASGAAMLRAWDRAADVSALWDAADAGDERAIAVRERAIEAMAWTLQTVSFVFDPETIVIGGGVSKLGGRLVSSLADTLTRRGASSPLIASYDITRRLEIAPVDAQFGVVGAALHARAMLADGGPG